MAHTCLHTTCCIKQPWPTLQPCGPWSQPRAFEELAASIQAQTKPPATPDGVPTNDGGSTAEGTAPDTALPSAQGTSEGASSVFQVASGFIKVANEAMCRPIRALTQMKVSEARKKLDGSWVEIVIRVVQGGLRRR